jgi:RNA polymerase sigma-70 factor (ECF subfamily)
MTSNSDATNHLLEQAARGDPRALGTLLGRHRHRLRRMVALRMDRRLQGRIDASDVIQEAYLDVRALERLKRILGHSPGGLGVLRP